MTTILAICGVWAAFCVLVIYAILRAGARCDGPRPEARSTDNPSGHLASRTRLPSEHHPVPSETDVSDAPGEFERPQTHAVDPSSSEDETFAAAKRDTPAPRS